MPCLHVFKGQLINIEALPGILGNRGIRPFISGEQGNKSITERNRGTKAVLSNQDFDFGEQMKLPIFFQGNKGTGTPSPHPREGLNIRAASCE